MQGKVRRGLHEQRGHLDWHPLDDGKRLRGHHRKSSNMSDSLVLNGRCSQAVRATIVTGSLFWNLVVPIAWTITRPLTSHLLPCLVDPLAFLSVTLRHFITFAKPCLARAVRPLSDCSSLTLDEACVVTCTDGYVAARDTETTLTCIFASELQSMLLEGSTHSCKLAPCDLSTLMPSSTVSHDGPNAVSGESCTGSCFDGNAAISGTAASTVWTCGSEGALVSDLTFPYPTCRGSSIVDTCMVF